MTEQGSPTPDGRSLEQRIAALTPAQRDVLDRLLAESGGSEPGIHRRPRTHGRLPVSFEQERLWFMNELVPYRAIFHVPLALRLRGRVEVDALRRAFARLTERHEALRTVFQDGEDGPCQVVREGMAVDVTVHDCRDAPDPELAARRRASDSVAAPFDLRSGPLLRCDLYTIGAEDHLFLLTQHHIISDYWSLSILLEELGALYSGELGNPTDLRPLDLHYPDFAYWQRRAKNRTALERQLTYWRDQLDDIPELLELPTDHPRPAMRTSQGAFHHVEFPAELVAPMRELAREHATTLHVAFLALYAGLLSRLTRQEVLVIGVPVAGRSRPETQRMVGYFLNWLAIRVSVADRPSLRQLVRRVGQTLTDAMAHQDVPFEMLVHELQPARQPGVTPIFQTSFSLRDGAPNPPSLPGLEVSFADLDGGATHFDLMAELWCEEDRVVGYLPYDDDLFDAATVARFADWMHRLLAAGTADPDRPVAALPLLSAEERRQAVGQGPSDLGAADTPVHQRFAEQARRRPEATALSDEATHLSYGELERRANRVAHVLRRRGVGPGAFVGIMLDRNADLVAAILGVLKSGAAYLPVDPDSPAARTAHQFTECSVAAVLVATDLMDRLPDAGPPAVPLDWSAPELARAQTTPVDVDVPIDAPAYVIYTSGSTGAPKGVVVSHANVARLFTAARRYMELGADDTWTLFHSCAFDFSVWEMWGALAHGGRLVVVPRWVTRAPDALVELVRRERVTVLSQTPSAFQQFSRVLGNKDAPDTLRLVVFGGEALEHAALAEWMRAFGDERPRLVNMYGITETTVHVTFRRVTAEDLTCHDSLIGRPLPDLALYLLDGELSPVPTGLPGEIVVGGAGVALGYQRSGGMTAERMVPDPYTPVPGARMYRTGDIGVRRDDGEIVYLGRADEQHKIRGHRVELGEVRAALDALDEVAESTVLAERGRTGHTELTAYVVPAAGRETTPTRVRRELARHVPDWMTPSSVVLVNALPLTRNGKLDRNALAELRARQRDDRSSRTPPEGETATALARIWSELLTTTDVGAQDDFFALGGHSLMVVRLVAAIHDRLGVDVPMETLFRCPQLQEMADALDAFAAASPRGGQEELPAPEPAERDTSADIAAVRAEIAARVAPPDTGADAFSPATGDTVLLTGATGFVGSFVLAHTLARGKTVVCLLRGGAERRDALVRGLRGLGEWREEYEGRIEVVDGDVGEPHLGMDPDTYRDLAGRVGDVVHTAAWVNHVYPYAPLADVNAHSAAGVLGFAATTRRKSVTLVSTSAVVDSSGYPEGAEIDAAPLTALPAESRGYVRSKAVAELYLEHARAFGVPAVAVRLPTVMGDRRGFQVNPADALWSWTSAMIATGSYPESFADPENELLQGLPGDAVAQAVSAAAPARGSEPGHRIVNAVPDVVCGTRTLLDGLRVSGHVLAPVPDREWYELVGGLDPQRVWVAGIARHIARQPGDEAQRRRLFRFVADGDPEVHRIVNSQAISSPEELAGYIDSLTRGDASARGAAS
ncbi:amino acid adenylation domain-containing protein/thioester reductase-like protein [Haloactinospora alba]|uniref:Amino acid adenylation domain-containing protein/thioester reductase-like protein n=1 Tax=Haloactinospora alba TaxID=405555 RepID=A0A543N959_9ACTN|nr:non-ribosomal peptide synthetase [Haloactinospora alba]TQN28363.1 amino acid adenylation domain-containing protein/thioester reductase-like protein [Haloactinospora alba]